jgi:SAM-dependent methyltransferase
MSEDGSNGYEGVASIYVAGRGTRPLVGDAIGAATVRAWAQAFPPGATVFDLGSGPGEPSTRILREAGLATYAVDASSAMVAAFRERFPGVPIEHNTVEASAFFGRTFDGVLALGLLFLLRPAAQALVIEKVTGALSLRRESAAEPRLARGGPAHRRTRATRATTNRSRSRVRGRRLQQPFERQPVGCTRTELVARVRRSGIPCRPLNGFRDNRRSVRPQASGGHDPTIRISFASGRASYR